MGAIKIPEKPPQTPNLVEKYRGNLFGEPNSAGAALLSLQGLSRPSKDYLHWDDFRRRPPLPGVEVENHWLVEKVRRIASSRLLPGKAIDGSDFWFVPTDDVQDWLHRFERQTGALNALPNAVNSDPDRHSYLMSTLLEEAFTSSVLEGAVATREQAKDMIRTGRPPRDRSERMILNNYQTMQQLDTWKNEPLSLTLLLDIHRLITQDALDNPGAAGRLRRADDRPVQVEDDLDGTVYFIPPPAALLPDRLVLLLLFANEVSPGYFLHPVLRAIILHFWLAYEHPFVDGNGRTARALFYWSMLRAGYPQFKYLSISHVIRRAPVQYARTFLEVESDENDLTYFIRYHLRVIDLAMRQLQDHIARKRTEVEEMEGRLRHAKDFNHRQQALLVHALKNRTFRYTIEGHQNSHGVVYQTARADLLGLARVKLLVQAKHGKAYIFTPASDLAEKLKGKK